MKTNLTSKLGIFLITAYLLSCSPATKIFNYNYKFSDSPYRNIIINLNYDSTFVMRNAVSGDLSFSFAGKWERINNQSILLINPNQVTIDSQVNAPREGEKIEPRLAFSDRSYIFPPVESDTIHFTNRFDGFILKNYRFVKSKRARD